MKKEQTQKRISKRMKELRGKLRKKAKGGNYYYRLTITNSVRKEFALKTTDEAEAIQSASPQVTSPGVSFILPVGS